MNWNIREINRIITSTALTRPIVFLGTLTSPRHQPVRRSITEEPNPCSRLHPLAARSYSPLPGRAEGVSQSAGNCVEHEDGRAAGGSAALQMWCGAILRYDSPPSTPQFVRTSRLVKAS